MKIAYFDCYYGVTPHKLLSAIIDAGVEKNTLIKEMRKLNISFNLDIKKERRGEVVATDMELKTAERKSPTTLKEIINLINLSHLELDIKNIIKFIFDRIAGVESKTHKKPKEEVGLYEVGQPKAILTVTGIAVGIKKLEINKIYCSEISLGSGKVKCSHGILPIPVPATALLIKNIPVSSLNLKGELSTPLGVAIISSLVKVKNRWGEIPPIFVERIGQGFGQKSGQIDSKPLTVYIGQTIP